MANGTTTIDGVTIERDKLIELVESGEVLTRGFESMLDGLRELATRPPSAAPAVIPAEPAAPRVWDLSDDALSNYDAQALIALRDDHRGDHHSIDGCRVCEILARRLGSLE